MSDTLTVSVPDRYIGEPVELLLYTSSESDVSTPSPEVKPVRPFDGSRFRGTLTDEEADRFHEYIRRLRSE